MLEHRFAKLAAGATFILLVIGGTVNPTGSSLACPEPTFVCHGHLFPPMVGGVLYEHGHRLAAMTVGFLQIALTIFLFRSGRKRLAFGLLGMILAQGLLGAITVKYKLPWFVSTFHLLLGMSYFAMLIYTAFKTRPAPSALELDRHERLRADLGPARRWIGIACGFVFAQLLLGALVRHFGAAMVCLGMPSCTIRGDWWAGLAPVQHVHMIHRGFGVLVAIATTAAAVMVYRRSRSWPQLRLLAMIAPLLVCAQIALGIFTVMTMRSVPVAVGHFAGAASLWALWMSAWLMTARRQKVVEIAPARVVTGDTKKAA